MTLKSQAIKKVRTGPEENQAQAAERDGRAGI